MKGFDHAHDPQMLKKMAIYQDLVNMDYQKDIRNATKEHLREVLNPLREVAKIELKGRVKRKGVAISNP